MKFIMMAMGGADYEAGKPPSPDLIQAIGELGQKAMRAGKLVFQAGLQPTRTGFRLGIRRGKPFHVDGPFTETKEVIGGLAIFECDSREEAMQLAQDFIDAHARCGIEDMSMEVRPMYGPEMGCAGTEAKMAVQA